jgi:hypothetical protein
VQAEQKSWIGPQEFNIAKNQAPQLVSRSIQKYMIFLLCVRFLQEWVSGTDPGFLFSPYPIVTMSHIIYISTKRCPRWNSKSLSFHDTTRTCTRTCTFKPAWSDCLHFFHLLPEWCYKMQGITKVGTGGMMYI